MAILTSTPGEGNKVSIYDIPDSELEKYAVSAEQAASMFPESAKAAGNEIPKSDAGMSPTTRFSDQTPPGAMPAGRTTGARCSRSGSWPRCGPQKA